MLTRCLHDCQLLNEIQIYSITHLGKWKALCQCQNNTGLYLFSLDTIPAVSVCVFLAGGGGSCFVWAHCVQRLMSSFPTDSVVKHVQKARLHGMQTPSEKMCRRVAAMSLRWKALANNNYVICSTGLPHWDHRTEQKQNQRLQGEASLIKNETLEAAFYSYTVTHFACSLY